MTKPRLPPLALVLLPALALAALGVRAVTAEMRASQDAARERARSVASRLARSVDALVAEYAGALPRPGTKLTRAEAKEATAHLQPRRAMTTDGVSLALDHDLPPDPGPVPETEAALVEDALQRAGRIANEPNGSDAAAALLAATARAVEHPVAKARLLFASVEFEPAAARTSERLAEVVALGAYRLDVDGRPFDLRSLRLLQGRVDLVAQASETRSRIEENPWGLGSMQTQPEIVKFEGTFPPGALPAHSGMWEFTRFTAFEITKSPPPIATFVFEDERQSYLSLRGDEVHGRGTLSVWTDVEIDGRRTLLGGDIPASTVDERIGGEARALASEMFVSSVRLVPRSGGVGLYETTGTYLANDVLVEAVPLAEPFAHWRAEAVVAAHSYVPATAWMLGAALVLTTGALLAGTFALRRAAERSARLADERRTFLDHVAHELRTPAAAVQALTEELASGHVTPEREALYREHLLRESRRLSALVEDTLDFARLDAGRLAFKLEPADLRDVVREAVEQSDGAGRVQATLPDAPVVRPIDAAALRRAVKNLVENAVRHGGGDAPVTVTLDASGGAACIVVADRGRGIAAEHLPRLFERFYRVPSATHEVKGVGLGLALCREIARGHGGDVTVSSEVGRGSAFTLRMPLA